MKWELDANRNKLRAVDLNMSHCSKWWKVNNRIVKTINNVGSSSHQSTATHHVKLYHQHSMWTNVNFKLWDVKRINALPAISQPLIYLQITNNGRKFSEHRTEFQPVSNRHKKIIWNLEKLNKELTNITVLSYFLTKHV